MLRKLLVGCVILLAPMFVHAGPLQDPGPHGSVATKKAKSDKMAKSSQLTGCIAAGDKEGTYKLTNGRYKNGVPVTSSDDLKPHVGSTVKLSGTWDNTATPKSFKADKLDMISDSCESATAGGDKGKSR